MKNKTAVSLELVDKVREFLATRWVINSCKNGGSVIPYEDWDDAARLSLESKMSEAYKIANLRIDEFGADKQYVIDLLSDESADSADVVAFVLKFTGD